jgi:hypothetical protein
MCRSTRGTQAASLEPVRKQQPNQPAGVRAPVVAPNAFLGFSERVPQLTYVADFPDNGFLGDAAGFYKFFGLKVEKIKSVHAMVKHLGKQTGVFERIVLVSHANPRGMLLPMFTGGVVGTNNDFFKALGKSDLDGLVTIAPFSPVGRHLFDWTNVTAKAMKNARKADTTKRVLTPFGLDKDGATPPSGKLLEFVRYCFDIVFANEPGRVFRTAKGRDINGVERTILVDFTEEILNQLTLNLKDTITGGARITVPQLDALRKLLKGMPFVDLGIPPGNQRFEMNVDDDSMNDFPTLKVIVAAIRNGFREQLEAARQHVDSTTLIDVRGCRVGQDPDFVESLRLFFGRPGQLPTVTAPRLFQTYLQLSWDPLDNRAHIGAFLATDQRGHSPTVIRERFGAWADLIRLRPLHTDFWGALLSGPALRLAALTWRADIPGLFIPAPGLEALASLDFPKVIARLQDLFNVPKAEMPKPADLKKLKPLIDVLPSHAPSLLASVPDTMSADKLIKVFEGLQRFNDDQQLTIVPAAAPSPLKADAVRQFQKDLLEHFDNGPLAPVKTFMTAAATSLTDKDGLYHYMLQTGVPVFLFGRPEGTKNSIILLRSRIKVAQQSWYRCLWTDPLPDKGAFKTAAFKTGNVKDIARVAPALVEDTEARDQVASVCPLPRYGFCIRRRPLVSPETDGPCGDLGNP